MATLDKLPLQKTTLPGVVTVDPGHTGGQARQVPETLVVPPTTQVILPETPDVRSSPGKNAALGLLSRQQKVGGKRQKAYPFKPITIDSVAVKALVTAVGPAIAQLQKLFTQDPAAFHANAQLAFAGQEKVA
jgi:hypothetical protein